jgi:hypothetical protein
MNMSDLAAFAGTTSRFARREHQCHVADSGDVELEALATAQARSPHHFHFGQLVVPVADAVDGLCAEQDAAPELADSELRGRAHATKYSPSSPDIHGATIGPSSGSPSGLPEIAPREAA